MKLKLIAAVTCGLLVSTGTVQAQTWVWYNPTTWFGSATLPAPQLQTVTSTPVQTTSIEMDPEPEGGFDNLGSWVLGGAAVIGAGAAMGSSGGSSSNAGGTGTTGTN